MELSRMALAAMDSEPVEMPLDYLQGHKDGLEWAAQLAKANHPETGDWLYDDPIELAKAIRKGPDMPPAQPAADSEPDRNPVLAYADSYRDMAKQGVESVPIWSVITDLERNIAPLYRHAQPVTVVPDKMTAIVKDEAEYVEGWNACRAAMLQGVNGTLTNEGTIPVTQFKPVADLYGLTSPTGGETSFTFDAVEARDFIDGGWSCQEYVELERFQEAVSGNSPVIPDAWIPVSEQMPEIGDIVLTSMGGVVNVGETECSAANCRFFTSVISGRELPATHWMPQPAAPKEVKGE
ncbi:TPA: DUF551 domain-containing protein [Klebsiella pneumoniae]|nr:DUF551 domain-containing protein [Klebsiella pneumoniae]MCB3720232.1 DUF551 domain-containing protein [Klebsiella pneumoniae]HBZ8765103.1 DUF551 domain-containing protein [Klebsiella pneumoniae]HBZ8770911.1 DUF551 domain-containing protein [Klebsiella pneumoniae]HBZ8826152.1 DUF551 domain-containing protein [Klebsiella pneumoniae]